MFYIINASKRIRTPRLMHLSSTGRGQVMWDGGQFGAFADISAQLERWNPWLKYSFIDRNSINCYAGVTEGQTADGT